MVDNAVVAGRVGLIGFPFDRNSSFMRGAAQAPPAIRAALHSESSNLWSEEGVDLGRPGMIEDFGDLEPFIPDPERAIEEAVEGLLRRGVAPICLGGDHSVTYPIVRACGRRSPELTVLHFDAHSDTYDLYQANRLSHACPFARIMEEGAAARLIQVGLRTMTDEHRSQIRRFGIEVVEMKDWPASLAFDLGGPVYVSIDLDVLDPAFAPGVAHPEPGGCSTRQLLEAIQRLAAPVIGVDLVEFNPLRDSQGTTAMVCAKIVKETASAILRNGRQAGTEP
ncbi:MAG: agmatinase [Acidobacteriota bacterium]